MYLLQVHGLPPTRKQDNVVRLLYENVNGLNNRISSNKKLERCKEMFDELEVDLVAMNEIKINFGHKKNINGLSQMFNGGDAAIKVVHGCNNHDGAISRVQEGGTGLIAPGAI